MIYKNGVQIKLSINWATPAPPSKYAKQPLVYMPDEPVDNGDDKVDEGGGPSSAKVSLTSGANAQSIASGIMWAKW